jgi:hypothetical protein
MLDLTPSTFEEFEREAERGNVVPVVRTVLADLQTPVGAFLRIAPEPSRASCSNRLKVESASRVIRFWVRIPGWLCVCRASRRLSRRTGKPRFLI